tara:strand:+ start:223 stop:462 length:240 start_codon:yes stop_codon:yes gene_type:complete
MKEIPHTKAREIVGLALDLMERIRGLEQFSVEVDTETGVQFCGSFGAFGSTSEMPRDLSERYLGHELSEMLEQESVHRN